MSKNFVYNYVIVQYHPNVFIDQFLNVGVIVIQAETFKIDYKIYDNQEKIEKVFHIENSYYDEMRKETIKHIEYIKNVVPSINQLKPMKEYIKSAFRTTDSNLRYSEFKTGINELTLKQNTKRLYNEFVTVFK